jgi:large subunit ribosomal protein L29
MRADKLRELDGAELNKQSADIQEQLFRLRFQMSMGQADGLKKYRTIKKDRARMLGIIRQRELNPGTAPAPVAVVEKKKRKAKE